MKTAQELFGLRIKELRDQKGFTQEKLAELIHIDSRTLSRIETGKNFTTFETLEYMAKAFNVDIEDLFSFNHQRSKKYLISDIVNLLDDAEEKNIKLIYKLVLAVLR